MNMFPRVWSVKKNISTPEKGTLIAVTDRSAFLSNSSRQHRFFTGNPRRLPPSSRCHRRNNALAEEFPVKSTTAEETAGILYREIMCRFGAPKPYAETRGPHSEIV